MINGAFENSIAPIQKLRFEMKKVARRILENSEIAEALQNLAGWSANDGKLHKQFKFDGFIQAIGWMVSVAIAAEKLDHHPEWSNVYNRVDVTLTTHDMGNQISTWDIDLAKTMDNLFNGQ